MKEIKYVVHSDIDENNIYSEFSNKEEAIKYASNHIEDETWVDMVTTEKDENGAIESTDYITIWNYRDGNCYDLDFPEADVASIDNSDDIDYDAMAKQYEEEKYEDTVPADWDDPNRFTEAVEKLEENEDEVECKLCFELFPKEKCIKADFGYICPVCAQELTSHQGTNLDLLDANPFDLDYDDPRLPEKEEESEVTEEPVDGTEMRKHEAGIEENLTESQAQEISETYKKLSELYSVDLEELVYGDDGFMKSCYPEGFPDFKGDVIYSEKYWTEFEQWLKDARGIELIDPVPEEKELGRKLQILRSKKENLEEHVNEEHPTIESDQEYVGADNAVVDCDAYTLVAHSEDEKPLDCKMEKAPLEKPLTEEVLDEEAPEIFHVIRNKKIDKEYGATGFDVYSKEIEKDWEAKKRFSKIADAIRFARDESKKSNIEFAMIQLKATGDEIMRFSKGNDTVNKLKELADNIDLKHKTDDRGNKGTDVTFKVSFDANGGTGTAAETEAIANKEVKLPENSFGAPEGKEFDAWEIYGEKKNPHDPVVISANTTIKALWKDKPAAEEETGEEVSGEEKTEETTKTSKPKNDAAVKAAKIRKVLKKLGVSEDKLTKENIREIRQYLFNESLTEATKKEDELPPDPEAVKLEVHTMLNNLVADEIEAINEYEEAKAEIIDAPIPHKDTILDTVDHIEDEEKEHVDELIDATTEIPFEGSQAAPAVEKPFEQDFPEAEVEENLTERVDNVPFDSDAKVGDKIRIIHLVGEDNSYDGKEGEITNIDGIGQLHGTWGGLAIIPGVDQFEILECLKEDTSLITETPEKPAGDKTKSYNDGLKLAKLHNKPVIYGYTNRAHDNKFFALEDPIICDNVAEDTKKFKAQYKNSNIVYVAYPDKDFAESCKLSEELFTAEEQAEYDIDENGLSNHSYDEFVHCGWCGEPFSKSECRYEADFGWICSRCEDELKAHGGPLTFIEPAPEE